MQLECLQAAKESGDYRAVIAHIPYASLLGVVMREVEGLPLFELPFAASHIGNVYLPALHGGVIGGFLENAALLHLVWAREANEVPRTVDFSLDFLRPGKPQATFARCDITKHGKRVANVHMQAWQDDEKRPIAVARAHFLLA